MAGSDAGPYDSLSDEAVLARAAAALRTLQRYRIGSMQRAIQWAAYDAAAAELDRRLGRYLSAYPLAARRGERR